jgi:hypothetical protein
MLNSLFIIFNILPYVTPLDEKSAFEKECFVPNVENVEVDYDWVKRNINCLPSSAVMCKYLAKPN